MTEIPQLLTQSQQLRVYLVFFICDAEAIIAAYWEHWSQLNTNGGFPCTASLGVLEHSSSCCCFNPNEETLVLCISVYMLCQLIYTKQLPVSGLLFRRWCKL